MNFGQNGGNMGFLGPSNLKQNFNIPGAAQLPNSTGQNFNNQSISQLSKSQPSGGFFQNNNSTFKNQANQGGNSNQNSSFQQQNTVFQPQNQQKKQPIQKRQNSKQNQKQFTNQNNQKQPNQQQEAFQENKNGPQGFFSGFQPPVNMSQQNQPFSNFQMQNQQQNHFQNTSHQPHDLNQTNNQTTQKQQSKSFYQKMRQKNKTNTQQNENSIQNFQFSQATQNLSNQSPNNFSGNQNKGFMENTPQVITASTQNQIQPTLDQNNNQTMEMKFTKNPSSEKPFKTKSDLRTIINKNPADNSKNQNQIGQGQEIQNNQKKVHKQQNVLRQFNQQMNNKNQLNNMKTLVQQHSQNRSQTKQKTFPEAQKTFISQQKKEIPQIFQISHVKENKIGHEVEKLQQDQEVYKQDYGGEECGEDEQEELAEQQQQMLQKLQPCVFYLQNICRKKDCPALHLEIPKVVEEQCPHFIFKTCSFGDKCKKNHSEVYKEDYLKKYTQAWGIQMEKQIMQSQFAQQANNKIQAEDKKVPKNEKSDMTIPQLQIFQPVAVPAAVQHFEQESNTNKLVKEIEIEQAKLRNLQKDPNFLNDPKFVAEKVMEYIQKFKDIQSKPQDYEINQKATCLKMCPQIDVQDPFRDRSHLERSNSDSLFSELAIKRFMRSDAGKNMTDPELLRPPIILWLTMEYMRDCLIDQDLCPTDHSFYMYQKEENGAASQNKRHQFNEIYSFMKDRTRQLSQDMSIINFPPNKYTINCLEQISRYLIVAAHDGMRELNFDIYSNLKQLTGCLGDLRDKQYSIVRRTQSLQQDSQLLKNENEMFLYLLIASSNDLEGYQKILYEIKHFDIKFQGQWKKIFREAIAIAQSVQLNDFVRFFKIFRKTNYMFACLMLNFVEQMRQQALFIFQKGLGKQEHPNRIRECQFFMKQLSLPNINDARLCLKAFGFNPQDSTEFQDSFQVNLNERQLVEIWSVLIKKFRQQYFADNLENIKKTKLKRDIISGGLLEFMDQIPEEILIIDVIPQPTPPVIPQPTPPVNLIKRLSKAFQILQKLITQQSFNHYKEQYKLLKKKQIQDEEKRLKIKETFTRNLLEQQIKLEKQLLESLKKEAIIEKNLIFEKKLIFIIQKQGFQDWQNYIKLVKLHEERQKERQPLEFIKQVYFSEPITQQAKQFVQIKQVFKKKVNLNLNQKFSQVQAGTAYFILPKGIVKEYFQSVLKGCQIKFINQNRQRSLKSEIKRMFDMVPDCLNVFCSDQEQHGFWSVDQLRNFKKEFFEGTGLLQGSGLKVNVFVICDDNSNIQSAKQSFEKIYSQEVILLMLSDLNDQSIAIELLNRTLIEQNWRSLMPNQVIIQKKRSFECYDLKEIIFQRTIIITKHKANDPFMKFREQVLMFVDALEDLELFTLKSHQLIFHQEAYHDQKLCNLRALIKIKNLRQIPVFQEMQIEKIQESHFDKIIQDVYIPSLIKIFSEYFSQDEFNNQMNIQYQNDHNWFKTIILQILIVHFVLPYKNEQKKDQMLYVDHEEVGQSIPKLNVFQPQLWKEKPVSNHLISKNEVAQCLQLYFPRHFDIEKQSMISYNLRKRGQPISSSVRLSEVIPVKKRVQKTEFKNLQRKKPIKKQEGVIKHEEIEEIETDEDHSIYVPDSPQENHPWYQTLIDTSSTVTTQQQIYIDLERELNLLEQRLY